MHTSLFHTSRKCVHACRQWEQGKMHLHPITLFHPICHTLKSYFQPIVETKKNRVKAWLPQGTCISQRTEALKIHAEQSYECRPQLGKMRGCHYKKCLRAPHLYRQTRCNPQLAFKHHYLQVPAPTAKQCCSAPLGDKCLMASTQPPAAGFQEQCFSQQNKKQIIVCFFFFPINKKKKNPHGLT